jgi:hypothetical protein
MAILAAPPTASSNQEQPRSARPASARTHEHDAQTTSLDCERLSPRPWSLGRPSVLVGTVLTRYRAAAGSLHGCAAVRSPFVLQQPPSRRPKPSNHKCQGAHRVRGTSRLLFDVVNLFGESEGLRWTAFGLWRWLMASERFGVPW